MWEQHVGPVLTYGESNKQHSTICPIEQSHLEKQENFCTIHRLLPIWRPIRRDPHQFQPNSWLCFASQFFGYAASNAPTSMCISKPFVRKEQSPSQQPVSVTFGLSQISTHLVVRFLVNRSAILSCDPDRFTSLLDHTQFVNQHDPIWLSQGFTYHLWCTLSPKPRAICSTFCAGH